MSGYRCLVRAFVMIMMMTTTNGNAADERLRKSTVVVELDGRYRPFAAMLTGVHCTVGRYAMPEWLLLTDTPRTEHPCCNRSPDDCIEPFRRMLRPVACVLVPSIASPTDLDPHPDSVLLGLHDLPDLSPALAKSSPAHFSSNHDCYLRLLSGTRKQQTPPVFCPVLPSPVVTVGCTTLDAHNMESVEDHHTIVAPGSPPELSYSKSSKSSASSSLRSSDSLSGDDSSTERLAHFEDIVLEEEEEADDATTRAVVDDCNVKPESRPTLRRPKRSTTPTYASTTVEMRRSHSGLALDARSFPSLRGQVTQVLTETTPRLSNGPRMRRSPTSPAGLTMRQTRQRVPSRSPSPSSAGAGLGHGQLPVGLPSPVSRDSWEARSPNGGVMGFAHQRRQSWQPVRKTVEELEAEYNDEDEEVPDEAILENVPISPMPGQPPIFPQQPALRSKTPSPNRRIPSNGSLHSAHGNLHSANVPKNAKRPSAPTMLRNGQYGTPRSPRQGLGGKPPMPPRSATVTSFSPEPFGNKHRSKSWSDDLNDEARQLSHALEELAATSSARSSVEKRHSGSVSAQSSPPRPNLSKMRAQTMVMERPPVQKGSIMIDPLPISKEKEAVLTRTRPSWLPPKSQKEEKKHMREWEQMMARAAEVEKKRASKQKEELENKEEMQDSIARIWEQHVLPQWDQVINEPRTRELWWRGVTPSSRAEVWQRAIGNELELSSASFEAALRRAHELEERVAEMPDEERSKSNEAAWLDAIARDVPTVIPEQNIFQVDGHLHQTLTDVLKAYAMYRRDVGYVYGTHLIVGILCLHLPAPTAFVVLANLLNRPLPLAFLVHDQAAMARTYQLVLTTLKYKFPQLHAHLTSAAANVQPDEFLDPFFRCLFAHNLAPEHVCRLLDVYVFEGDKTLIRAAVAVLGRLEPELYGSRQEILDLISWRCERRWDALGSEEDFVRAVRDAGKVAGRPA
nr:tbc domain-containing protein c23d3.03c [Quercus suber]